MVDMSGMRTGCVPDVPATRRVIHVNAAGASSRTGDNPVVDSVTPGTVIPGTLIADRYRLLRPLGSGSSATVWEASDTALDRTVAVKLLHGSAVANPTERERLR